MSGCPALSANGVSGLADALKAIDCRTGEATALAFGRLFGPDGRLLTALSILLTLYVAFLAISLLTGRSRMGLAAFTPRMIALGMVLTFATSWAAYQNVVWTLAVGASDEVATLVTGSNTSATAAFAERLDNLFGVVAEAADQASVPAAATDTGITPAETTVGGVSGATLLWLSALMLLLGTVGVLVTAKIAVAALLAIGPVFIVLALFGGTRGLFEGWARALVTAAIVPLFTVLIGGAAVSALTPLVAEIAAAGTPVPARAVTMLFLGSVVYLALMAMAMRAAATVVSGWRPRAAPGEATAAAGGMGTSVPALDGRTLQQAELSAGSARGTDERVRAMLRSLPSPGSSSSGGGDAADVRVQRLASAVSGGSVMRLPAPTPQSDHRVQATGSRFRSATPALAKGKLT